jgi:predicted RNA-binding Zn-ribbon protein involved in translation (DUF1610 family)
MTLPRAANGAGGRVIDSPAAGRRLVPYSAAMTCPPADAGSAGVSVRFGAPGWMPGFFLDGGLEEWVMVKSAAELFKCPNCGSQYKLVRVEADPAALYGQIECAHCGGPLENREGKFILKYFLVDHPRRQIRPPRSK